MSDTTYILLPKLPWVDQPQQPMSSERLEPAALFQAGVRSECGVQSLSAFGATLHGSVTGEPGAEVTMELATGQRPSGTIAWTSGSSFGVGFTKPIDVLVQINRNLVSQPAERRRMPRVELRCTGWLKHGDEFTVATVRNLSAGGLQLEAEALPNVGAEALLYLEGLNVPPGELIWKRDKLAGVQFRQELGWALIMPWLREILRKPQDSNAH